MRGSVTEGKKKRMANGGTKRIVLVGVFIALLVGLLVGIKFMSSRFDGQESAAGGQGGTGKPPANPMPKLTPANMEAKWPQVVANAAAPPLGTAGTRYTLAEFGDFQCPQCSKARPLLEKLLAQYPAQVNLIFVHRPIPSIHEWAMPAGQAAEIAATQGKFWPMYDMLYSHPDDLQPGFYGDYAAKAGLDRAAFQKAFDARQGMDKLKAVSAFSDSLSIIETPTFLLRDNVAKTITIYVGLDAPGNAKDGIPYTDLMHLVAAPPWTKH